MQHMVVTDEISVTNPCLLLQLCFDGFLKAR